MFNTFDNIVSQEEIVHNIWLSFPCATMFSKVAFCKCFKLHLHVGKRFDPLPHIDAFRHLCSSLDFWKHCDKGEIAHDEQFHHLPQCFQLYLIIKLSLMAIFHIFEKMFSKLSPCQICCMMWEKVKEYRWMDNFISISEG